MMCSHSSDLDFNKIEPTATESKIATSTTIISKNSGFSSLSFLLLNNIPGFNDYSSSLPISLCFNIQCGCEWWQGQLPNWYLGIFRILSWYLSLFMITDTQTTRAVLKMRILSHHSRIIVFWRDWPTSVESEADQLSSKNGAPVWVNVTYPPSRDWTIVKSDYPITSGTFNVEVSLQSTANNMSGASKQNIAPVSIFLSDSKTNKSVSFVAAAPFTYNPLMVSKCSYIIVMYDLIFNHWNIVTLWYC
mgnify:CR=1 FL=1